MFFDRLSQLKAIRAFVALLRNPDATSRVFIIANALRNTKASQKVLNHLRATPQTARVLAERYQGPAPDLEALQRLPVGSLGYELVRHLRDCKLQVMFYPQLAVKDDFDYVEMRIRNTHDIWHTVTGIGVTAAEELGLQAFMLAQECSALAPVLIAGGLLRTLFWDDRADLAFSKVMEAIDHGWQLGRAAQPLLAQKWEQGWARPLADWQKELGLPATVGDPAARAPGPGSESAGA